MSKYLVSIIEELSQNKTSVHKAFPVVDRASERFTWLNWQVRDGRYSFTPPALFLSRKK